MAAGRVKLDMFDPRVPSEFHHGKLGSFQKVNGVKAPDIMTFAGDTEYTFEHSVAVDNSFSQNMALDMSAEVLDWTGPSKLCLGIEMIMFCKVSQGEYTTASAKVTVDRESTWGVGDRRTTSWSFLDSTDALAGSLDGDLADVGDSFVVRVREDPKFGVPMWQTLGGMSKCRCEPGTACREKVGISVAPASLYRLPEDAEAVWTVDLQNLSPTRESWDLSNSHGYDIHLFSETEVCYGGACFVRPVETARSSAQFSGPLSGDKDVGPQLDGLRVRINNEPVETRTGRAKYHISFLPYGVTKVLVTALRGPYAHEYKFKLELRSTCDARVLYSVWLSAEFVRPCNGITWAQTVLNQGELRVNLESGDPDKGRPYKLPIYLQNRERAKPFALRGPKTEAWNPSLDQVILVIRCVAVACTPKEREWVVVKNGRGRVSLMVEPDVGVGAVWAQADPLKWDMSKVLHEDKTLAHTGVGGRAGMAGGSAWRRVKKSAALPCIASKYARMQPRPYALPLNLLASPPSPLPALLLPR